MGKKDDPRAIALEILLESERGGGKATDIIKGALERYSWMDVRDRALFKNISEGTLERRITLDYVIDRFSHVKTVKMKPVIRNILRMGCYQLLFLKDIPAAAVCNESVGLARRKHMDGLTGFVNGVLRSVVRSDIDISRIEDLSVRYSMPRWIAELLISEYGRDTAIGILEASTGRRPLYIRANLTRINRDALIERLKEEGAEALIANGIPEGYDIPCALELRYNGSPAALPSFREGLFSIQDLSSMAAGIMAAPAEGEHILDICAAPGGKSCHMAEMMNGSGLVDSRDLTEKKAELVRDNMERLGLQNILVSVLDATVRRPQDRENFDKVMADLPCSGLGVMGRKNDLKYRIQPEDIAALAELQKEILKNTEYCLKPGGRLLYSVCTISREETFSQAEWIEKELGLKKEGEKLLLPEFEGTDGFYMALFKKGK